MIFKIKITTPPLLDNYFVQEKKNTKMCLSSFFTACCVKVLNKLTLADRMSKLSLFWKLSSFYWNIIVRRATYAYQLQLPLQERNSKINVFVHQFDPQSLTHLVSHYFFLGRRTFLVWYISLTKSVTKIFVGVELSLCDIFHIKYVHFNVFWVCHSLGQSVTGFIFSWYLFDILAFKSLIELCVYFF